MTLVRSFFLATFLLIVGGGIAVRNAVTPLFNRISSPRQVAVVAHTATPTAKPSSPTTTPSSTPTPSPSPRPTNTIAPTATPTVAAHHVARPTATATRLRRAWATPSATPRATATRTATATPKATATSAPTPTAAMVALNLSQYWIGSLSARPGQTIAVGYVIDNPSGHVVHMLLGASIKPARVENWAVDTISDPYHDVVATIPPGVTHHLRYFTLPSGLAPGRYDVAWGLRDPVTGERAALVFAPTALLVHS